MPSSQDQCAVRLQVRKTFCLRTGRWKSVTRQAVFTVENKQCEVWGVHSVCDAVLIGKWFLTFWGCRTASVVRVQQSTKLILGPSSVLDFDRAWFQASAVKRMKTALCWVITQPVVVIWYRRFGTTYRSHRQGSRRAQFIFRRCVFCAASLNHFSVLDPEDAGIAVVRNVVSYLPINTA